MKLIFKIFSMISLGSLAHSHEVTDISKGIIGDPRPTTLVHKIYSNGEEAEGTNTPYIIIAWVTPSGKKRGYQIWGNDQIIDQDTTEAAIQKIFKNNPADVYILGNNWGAGSELDKLMKILSKKHQVEIFRGSPFGFRELAFRPESEERQKKIASALEALKPKTPK